MRRSSIALLLAACLIVVLAASLTGCSGSAPAPAPSGGGAATGGAASGGTTINEQGFAFSPSKVTVKVGDTVTFTNGDSAAHNVSIDGNELGSQNQGESKQWTATKAGTFPFSCTFHPSMTGVITVQ